MKYPTLLLLLCTTVCTYSAEETSVSTRKKPFHPAPHEALAFAKTLPPETQKKIASYLVSNPLHLEELYASKAPEGDSSFTGKPCLAFHPNGTDIAFLDYQEKITVLDTEQYKVKYAYLDGVRTSCVEYSRSEPDHRLIAVDRGTCYIQTHDGRELFPSALPRPLEAIAINPTNTTLAFVKNDFLHDPGEIRIWNYARGGHFLYLNQSDNLLFEIRRTVNTLSFSNDGTILASGAGSIKLWSPLTAKLLCTLCNPSIVSRHKTTSLAFNHDDTLLASGSRNRTVKIWHIDKKEIENSKAIRRLVCRTAVTAVKFDATGTLLAASSTDGAITLFDPHSGELLYTIEGNGKATTSLAFHPTEQKLAAASYDQPLRVWALLSAMPRPSFNVFSSMATLDQANLFHSLQKCARKRQQLSKQVNAGEIASADDRTVMEEIEKRHPNVYEAMLSLCAKTGISYTKNPTKEVNLADNLSFMQTLTE